MSQKPFVFVLVLVDDNNPVSGLRLLLDESQVVGHHHLCLLSGVWAFGFVKHLEKPLECSYDAATVYK